MIAGVRRVAAHGVVVELAWHDATDGVAEALVASLPPLATPAGDAEPSMRVVVRARPDCSLEVDGLPESFPELGLLVHRLERIVGSHVALHSPQRVFFHAGVVGTPRGAVILPGRSFAGKTTLVTALLERGCSYFSDEYAVIDAESLVHPYPRRLSLRVDGQRRDLDASHWAAETASAPAPVAAVVAIRYDGPGEVLLQSSTAGDAAMALIDNAIAARSRPAEVLRAASGVARSASAWTGRRGEADEAAERLLAAVLGH